MSGIFENTLCSVPFQGNYLATASATADALDLTQTAALIEREGLRFDGTAFVPLAIPNTWSASGFEYSFNFLYSGSTDLTPAGSATGGLVFYVSSTGLLFSINHQGVTNGCTWALNSAATSASEISVTYDGTGYKVIQNGVDCVISSFATGTITGNRWNYSTAITQPFTRLGCDIGTAYWNGTISRFTPWNYVLTVAERAALTRRGLVTLPEQRGGSMVGINTAAWNLGDTSGGSITGNSATGFTVSGNSNYINVFSSGSVAVIAGKRVRITITATGTTGAESYIQLNTGGTFSGTLDASANAPFLTGTNTYDLTATLTGTVFIRIVVLDAASPVLSGIAGCNPLGTLFEQDSGQRNAGLMVGDTSGNKLDLILPASGVSIIDPAQRGTIRFTTTTSGNQQIGGTQVIIPTNARISSWVINSSGTPDVTLGNVSAGAQYRASAAVVSGDNQITLLTPFTTTGNLWVNSSTTATLKHTIQWEFIQ
jgi:hypothetical protein